MRKYKNMKKVICKLVAITLLFTMLGNFKYNACDAETQISIHQAETIIDELNSTIKDNQEMILMDVIDEGNYSKSEIKHFNNKIEEDDFDEAIDYLKTISDNKTDEYINKEAAVSDIEDLQEQEFINPSTGKSFSSVLEVKKFFETQGIEIDDSYYEICRKTEQIKEANSSMELSQLIVEVNDEIVAKDRKIFTWGDNVEASSLYQETRAQWNTLTDKEKSLVIIEPRKAMATKALANQAYDMTQDEFGYNGLGDKSDGFRHGVWNALMTRDITRAWADLYATAHGSGKTKKQLEKKAADGYKEKEHRKMDLHNNAVGRDVINWYDTFLNVSDKKLKKRVKAKLTNKSSEIYWLHK